MSEQLTIIAHLHVREEKLEEAKAFLLDLVDESRSEGACVEYHLHQDTEDPHRLAFYENWADRASWDKHMETPALKKLAGRRDEFFRSPTELHLMRMISRRA